MTTRKFARGSQVWVSQSGTNCLASASANRTLDRLATILHPYNPRWEHDKWVVDYGNGHHGVADGSMIEHAPH